MEDQVTTFETLTEIEKQEFRAVDVLSRLAQRDPRRPKLQAALDRLRLAKGELLHLSPDILRKSAAKTQLPPVRWLGFPSVPDEVAKAVHEARDRAAEEGRLGDRRSTGRRRYQAPTELRGKRIDLVDGQKLDVPAHGLCEIADGRHPAARDNTESPVHHQLVEMGFRLLAEEGPDDDGMTAIKSALRRPMFGDPALMKFLTQNAARSRLCIRAL
jgi:hypothetical protein